MLAVSREREGDKDDFWAKCLRRGAIVRTNYLHLWEKFCMKLGREEYAWLLLSVFAALILITVWLLRYHSNDIAARRLGKQGEAKVKKLLRNTRSLKKRILNNVILKVEYGNTVQIDHILINEYGVFVIETKNFKGVVYGTESKNYWRQYLKNKSFTFYNPIRQNESHIQHLKEMFGKKYPYRSIIVFAGNTVKKIDSDIVFSLSELEFYLDSLNEKLLRPKDIRSLYRAVRSTQKHKRQLNRLHLRNVKKYRRSPFR